MINGSPRKDGDTAALVAVLKMKLTGSISEIWAYHSNISPCMDCRKCWVKNGCVIEDDMGEIFADDFDVVIIASPIYMSGLPGPLVSLISRFQAYYMEKEIIVRKRKTAALILVGGGEGKATYAINLAKWVFKYLNAKLKDENIVFSLKTDNLPAKEDEDALRKIENMALRFNNTLTC